MPQGERRLAAIVFTDMVGYTTLGQRNESLALAIVAEQRKLIRPVLKRHRGREIKTMGDAFLVEFPSALDAVKCSYDIQRTAREYNISAPVEPRIHLRIGIHLGDVTESDGDISGDAVNVASRIEDLAEDGGVCLTRQVFDHVQNKFQLPLLSLGLQPLKNVDAAIEVYKMVMPWNEEKIVGAIQFDKKRVAVLPFSNISPDPADEYFADGMTEEVISTLSRLPDIEVISRTSVMHYKKNPKPIKEVSKELDVGSILEGSVRKVGNRLRISIQMIDASRDRHLWAESYDKELQDIFAIQSEVAARVAEALTIKPVHGKIASPRRKPTTNAEAYTLYLKGRYYWNKRGPENVKTAMGFFEQAVRQDPRFALGYVGLADCQLILSGMRIDLKANREKSKAMLSKALELEPELAEARASNGLALLTEYRRREAEEEFRKALELNPSYAPAHLWYSHLLRAELRSNEALDQVERAIALDPLSANMYTNLASCYWDMRDYRTALDHYKRGAELDPSYAGAHLWAGDAYSKMRMFNDAKREYGIAVQLLQHTYPQIGKWVETLSAYMSADQARVRILLPEIDANAKDGYADATQIAILYFYLGEDDKGFGLLDLAYSNREYPLMFIQCDPEIPDRVRSDPRYSKLLKRLGLK